jgi:hypothetical protein
VRKIVFREAEESISLFTTIVKEIDWALCKVILKGNTLGRIRRMIEHVSISSVNILSRSLLVLNLYFDDKLFGQLNLTDVIVQNMQQLSHIPDAVFANTCAQAFLNRLAKPMYDILKVLLLNRNRQRAYIEAVMLHDWSSFRQEAHVVDMTFKKENPSLSESAPHFSLYILCITIELMDHFVVLGLELNLFCGEHELAVACWYRDFLLSSLLSQVSTMRSARMAAKQVEAQQQITANNTKSHKGKKKGGKQNRKNANGNNPNQAPSPEDVEDEFYFLLLNLKRGLCRGIVRVSITAFTGEIRLQKYPALSGVSRCCLLFVHLFVSSWPQSLRQEWSRKRLTNSPRRREYLRNVLKLFWPFSNLLHSSTMTTCKVPISPRCRRTTYWCRHRNVSILARPTSTNCLRKSQAWTLISYQCKRMSCVGLPRFPLEIQSMFRNSGRKWMRRLARLTETSRLTLRPTTSFAR